LAVGVKHDGSIINVLHLRRFDRRVIEPLVGRVEGVVDPEVGDGLPNDTRDGDVPGKEAGITPQVVICTENTDRLSL
jgi:hypothetical protein